MNTVKGRSSRKPAVAPRATHSSANTVSVPLAPLHKGNSDFPMSQRRNCAAIWLRPKPLPARRESAQPVGFAGQSGARYSGSMLAKRFYDHYRRALYDNVTGGAGLSVLYRSTPEAGSTLPRSIDFEESATAAVVLLLDEHWCADPVWVAWARKLLTASEEAGLRARVFPVTIAAQAMQLHIAEQAIRWHQWDDCADTTRVEVFLSHSKHDDHGARVATLIRQFLYTAQGFDLGSFFDVHDIPPGLPFHKVILQKVRTSAEPLANLTIALSISESEELAQLGLAPEHLQDAMAEVARFLLALGARLLYGGDLRPGGFTQVLFELVARHRRDANEGDNRLAVDNLLAWPVHLQLPAEQLKELSVALHGLANLVYLTADGDVLAATTRRTLTSREPTAAEWAQGLSTMRSYALRTSNARIVLGGKTSGFQGVMPGVAQEALYSLQAGQPLFLLAGFGGCTRDLAEMLGLLPRRNSSPKLEAWPNQQAFTPFGADSLNNGLTRKENELLARTVHIDQAVTLILRGLLPCLDTFLPDRIASGAYELSVGTEFFTTNSEKKVKIKLKDGEQFVIKPGQFALLVTKESIHIPNDKLGFISIKAGVKFKGLINVSGFHVDPGFKGKLKFSVYNAGSRDILLTEGQRLFPLWLGEFTSALANNELYHGHFQHQDGITTDDISRIEGKLFSPNVLSERIRELDSSLTNIKIYCTFITTLIIGIFIKYVIADVNDSKWRKFEDKQLLLDKKLARIDSIMAKETLDVFKKIPNNSNLEKTRDRFRNLHLLALPRFDAKYAERFPDTFIISFVEETQGQFLTVKMLWENEAAPIELGDPLTDNARQPNQYRYHDVFHLGHVAFLGWSPVLRHLMKLKRKSDSSTLDAEDRGRAQVAEEAISLIGYDIRNSSIRAKPENQARLREKRVSNAVLERLLRMKISWASTVVVLIGKDTHARPWVNWEIDRANEQGKRIIGVYARGGTAADIPPSLEKYSSAIVGWNTDSIMAAIDGKHEFQNPDGGSKLKATGQCVFAMKVTQKVTFNHYWNDAMFACKKPVRNGSKKMMMGDNIYVQNADQSWQQLPSHHSHPDGSPNHSNIKKDTKYPNVLVSSHFYYFGSNAKVIPAGILQDLGYKNWRGHRVFAAVDAGSLITWLEQQQSALNKVVGDPFDFDKSTAHYSAATNKISYS
nr:hypothetical protein [Tanacetum cinerariifolium]